MLIHGKSSGIISNNKLIHLSLCCNYYYIIQGRNEPVQLGSNSPGNKITMGQRMTAGGARNFQQCHKYFIQCSKCASIRPQIQI